MSTFKACKRTRHTDAVTADQCAAKCTGSLASKCFTLFTDLDAGTESRYTYSTERLTWDDARDACRTCPPPQRKRARGCMSNGHAFAMA